MKIAHWTIAVATLASLVPLLTQRASGIAGGPISVIYRASGVTDNGGPNGTGVATSIFCTNTSPDTEQVVIVIRKDDGSIVYNNTFLITTFSTRAWSTHLTNVFVEASLDVGVAIQHGVLGIGSTTTNLFCSVMVVDAASTNPVGIPLHMIRYNPAPGTTE